MSLLRIKLISAVEFETRENAEIAYKAIKPEIESSPSDRAKGTALLRGSKIFIKLTGNDRSAVRSSLNSYMRWLKLSKELIDYGKRGS